MTVQTLDCIHEEAKRLFQQYNCCQTMILAFSKSLNYGVSAPMLDGCHLLGGGVCGSQESCCGAILGTILVLGTQYSSPAGKEKGQAFLETMKRAYGSVQCADILQNCASPEKKEFCTELVLDCCTWLYHTMPGLEKGTNEYGLSSR